MTMTVWGGMISFFTSHRRCLRPFLTIDLVLIIMLLIPIISVADAGTIRNDSGTNPENRAMTLTISFPENNRVIWIDVVPPDIYLRGEIRTSGTVSSIIATSDAGNTSCGNQTLFGCTIPVKCGNNTITVTASDNTGATVSETRNFTVNIGLPPPQEITIIGYVRSADGLPMPGASVTVVSSMSYVNVSRRVSVVTGEDGTYRIGPVLGYRHNISVGKQGYAPTYRKVVLGNISNSENFTLEPLVSPSPGFDIPVCLAGILAFLGILMVSKRLRE